MPLAPGTRLGNYEIVAPLGAGGMGEVYRARDGRLGREVAVKVLPEAFAGDAERLARLEREARTVAGLSHPNIVVLYSVEQERGVRFLTMELVEGQSLVQLVKPGGLPLKSVLDLSIPLADALAAAHERHVVHRDLKPANVMVTREGRVKILDFGLAKVWSSETPLDATQEVTAAPPLSSAGEALGTAPYMAPEQIRGEPVDARTDLFAFGILLYELLTGQRPFQGATFADLSSAILRDAPAPVQALRPDLPPDVGRIVARCLEKDPEWRVQTARDVRNELERVRRALESGAARAPLGGEAPSRRETLPSIAVLPFANRSRGEEDEYFADGITEDVIAQLCKMRALKVISRTSVMPFKKSGESLREIAARLGVANVLEGSVRRVGDRVRIVAQLIDASSGQHLWAETYDRQLTDIFTIQTDVALQIASALQAELSHSERERIAREPTRNMEAYEEYLRGRHCFVRFTREGFLRSIDHFDRAIGRDPEFALAYAGLAKSYTELAETGGLGRDQAGARAMAAAAKAIALGPELGEAHCADAYARFVFEFDWTGAEAGFRRALELSPGSADTYDLYGRLCAGLARFDDAIALHERARGLDPVANRTDLATSLLRAGRSEDAARSAAEGIRVEPQDPRPHATLGWALFRLGREEEGLAELERAVALVPAENVWLAQLGEAYGLAGKIEKARGTLKQLEDPSRPVPASLYQLAYVYTGLGDTERALECLERAFEQGGGPMYGIKGSFLFAPLRDHPRFISLLKRMRLV